MSMQNPPGQIGIKDLARALKISIGTVDRALHNRPGVSEHTKARVLKKAAEFGYTPNIAAQSLKLNRRLSIAAVLPREIAYFFDPVREGIRAAATAASANTRITLDLYEYPHLGAGEEEAFGKLLQKHVDGIIFLPGNMRRFDSIIRNFTRSGTAMMCVGSDAPNSDRIGSVAVDAYVSGAIAAELLAFRLTRKANVAVFSGELSTLDHAEKLRGFAATLAVHAPHLSLLPALEGHERQKEAYRQARNLLEGRNRPEGIYLSTANSMPVLQAIDELGLMDKVITVTTDLYHDLVPYIEASKVMATIHQRPFTQGRLAFEHLLTYLLREDKPRPFVRLAPHLVFRSNLGLFRQDIPERHDDIHTELQAGRTRS